MHLALVLLFALGASQALAASDLSASIPGVQTQTQQIDRQVQRDLALPEEGALLSEAILPHAPSAIAAAGTTFSSLPIRAHSPVRKLKRSQEGSAIAPASTSRAAVYALVIANHGSAVFDTWATRRPVDAGGRELNPLLKPVAESNALYPAMQLWPTVVDVISMKMRNSQRTWMRKLWWVPQLASTTGFVAAGVNNLNNYRKPVAAIQP